MDIYIFIYIYIHIHVYIYGHIYIYIHIHTCVCVTVGNTMNSEQTNSNNTTPGRRPGGRRLGILLIPSKLIATILPQGGGQVGDGWEYYES